MNRTAETLEVKYTPTTPTLYMAFELSNAKWKIAFSNGEKIRTLTINAKDLAKLQLEIEKAKQKLGLSVEVPVVSCYEAGRDGFWLHRYLLGLGLDNKVVDSASIEVNRRSRRAKSDTLDADVLLRMLLRHCRGEKGLWSEVNVPAPEAEDERRLHRELDRLRKEVTSHRNRIRSLLVLHGLTVPGWNSDFPQFLDTARTLDNRPLPVALKSEIVHELERLELVAKQVKELEKEQLARVQAAEENTAPWMVKHLVEYCGIGVTSAWVFVMEFYSWRDFKNRRQVASLAGLTPSPYDSGNSKREQGISKAGNCRVRRMAVEIAWCWLRYQPKSKLSQWFNSRFGEGGKRMRRIGIVALARKILVAIWRLFKYGVEPEGVRRKAMAC